MALMDAGYRGTHTRTRTHTHCNLSSTLSPPLDLPGFWPGAERINRCLSGSLNHSSFRTITAKKYYYWTFYGL